MYWVYGLVSWVTGLASNEFVETLGIRFINPHQRCGYPAIRHLRGYIVSILQGLEMGWRGIEWCVHSQEIVKMR